MVIKFEGYKVVMGFKSLRGVRGVIFEGFYISFFISLDLNCKIN